MMMMMTLVVVGAFMLPTRAQEGHALSSFGLTEAVTTTSGPVSGEVLGVSADEPIYSFKSIPYAAASRWEAPQDPEPWSDSEPLNATTFGPICPQPDPAAQIYPKVVANVTGMDEEETTTTPTEMSEDECLTLNVYSPTTNETANLPVMVWIHGGALIQGTGQSYPPESLVAQGIVLVTINYRLGFLGYFAHPELGDATNFGLLDQIKALEWVQKNIAAFGGDPDRVTIFGESAGGTSVLALMVSPLSKGLFHGAIAESPAVFESLDIDVSKAGKIGVAVGEALNIPAGDGQLEQMRSVPAPNFTLASVEKSKEGLGPMTSAFLYVDGSSLTADILQGFEKGMNHKVPLIIGSTADEMDMMKAFVDIIGEIHPQTSESYREVIEKTFGADAEAVLSVLPGETDQQALDAAYQLDTDVVFGTPAYLIAKSMASQRGNDEDVFLYYFTQRLKGKVGEKLGAFHASELPYVFNDTEWFIPIANQELANTVNTYWAQFARTGNPNANTRQDYLPEWKALLGEEEQWWQVLGPEVSSEPIAKDRKKIYNLARALYPNHADIFLKTWWSMHDTMQDSHSSKPF